MDESKELITAVSIGAREEGEDISFSKDTSDVELKTNSTIRPTRPRNVCMVQNFHLVWLDEGIDEVNDENYRDSIMKLRQVVNTVNAFTDADECIDFITDIQEKAFMIISERFNQTIISIIQDIHQVSSIYILGENNLQYKKWAKEWPEVAGVWTDITLICEALEQAAQDSDHNYVTITFAKKTDGSTGHNRDTLDSSFMYTQILKEILLTIDFDQGHIKEFFTYCREQFADNYVELKNVDKIEKEYRHHQPIWWYTYQCFLYSMLNRALRLMEVNLITTMGFFVRDLHEHIAALHSEQHAGQSHSNSFIVYRGQGLSQVDFDQLQTTQGGLLAFNNFLSTSLDREVSLRFARRTINTSDKVGVLFVMKIDPSISATPFANVKNVSYFQGEEEILFSMHSVFRIAQVKPIEKNNNRLWQVKLTLTCDNDPQLQAVSKYMRKEFSVLPNNGWYQLGRLLLKVAQFDRAQQIFEMILDQTRNENDKANIYNMLGTAEFNNGEYRKAIAFHEKALEIYQNIVSSNHFTFPTSTDNSDLMNMTTDDCRRAITSFEEAAEMLKQTLPRDDPSLAEFYDRCGSACEKMGVNIKALSFYHCALRIKERKLLSNHPSLAASYAHFGAAYEKLENSQKVDLSHQWALCIEKCLMCETVATFSTTDSIHQRAHDIAERSLPVNHPDREKYTKRFKNGVQKP